MKNTSKNIDLSTPRRKYLSKEFGLSICPECGSGLTEEYSSILLRVKSDSDEGEFMTSLSGSHFCNNCPVVVFDSDKVELAARVGIRGDQNLRYAIAGLIDLDAIPKDKKHLAVGCDENPIPLVQFLPDLNSKTVTTAKKPERNDPCLCGSGKKYKNCFG
ncbi:MAG: SEC-C metal-binding domain-containing protein [Draconibacterium sp.]|nr:SEC-C metal-binding domain-containing protein [Draconibacterium sp.]